MLLRILSLFVFFIVTVSAAEARQRHRREAMVPTKAVIKVLHEMEAMRKELTDIKKLLRPQVVVDLAVPLPSRNPLLVKPPMSIPDPDKTIKGYAVIIAKSAKLKDLTPKLADKVAEILTSCPGSRLTSGYRRGARVRGSGRLSLHSQYPSKAADLAGNPGCIRKKLTGWPGGLSTDYTAVRHYHVSYAPRGREWGMRFAHYRPRYARHHKRYAAVQ